jgi:hypothetical protein
MKKTKFKRILSVILSFVLIAVIALTMYGCGKQTNEQPSESTTKETVTEQTPAKVSFTFKVTHKDGSVATFDISTDKKYVGEALIEGNYIAGEDGDYGLYVKTVDGETLDYNTDKMYWAFYEDGNYALKGVDQTEIVDGKTYEFKAEK